MARSLVTDGPFWVSVVACLVGAGTGAYVARPIGIAPDSREGRMSEEETQDLADPSQTSDAGAVKQHYNRSGVSTRIVAYLERSGTGDKCGSRAGYYTHRRNNETPCDACRQANSDYQGALRLVRRVEEKEIVGGPLPDFRVTLTCRSCGGLLRLQNVTGPLFRGGELKMVVRCRPCHLSFLVRVLMDDGFETEP